MRFLLTARFSYIDLIWMSAMSLLLAQGRFLTALITCIVGVITTVTLERAFKAKSRDREWMTFADAGERVSAIRQHRIIYGSSLKEAMAVVDPYMGRDKP